MSHALQSVNVTGADIGPARGDRPYPPQSAPVQESHGTPIFVDGSGPIFSMYLKTAKEDDEKMAEGWKADADSILVFTGLFSAAVASLISVSIQDIRPNPQDTSNFYLANIYQTLADPASNVSTSLPASPPPFTPPNYAIWVKRTVFLEFGDQYQLCSTRDATPAVGTKIPQGHSTTLQPTQACADPCFLFRGRREISRSMGGRSTTDAAARFLVPVLCRRLCVPMER
ncbi:hypothetical protein H4582DRAFT_2060436 [Lactarius indigo]|nr:hypothetical protein H4582DRAFT_2060436 [Lactarius indigo]